MKSSYIKLYLLFFIIFSYQQNVFAQTKIIGYLPVYKGLFDNAHQSQLDKITHLNIAFLNPDKQGVFRKGGSLTCIYTQNQKLLSEEELRNTIEKAQKSGVLVSMSIGGASVAKSCGNWRSLLKDDKRQTVINNLLELVDRLNLDGLDVDIESKLLMSIVNDDNFLPFIQSLSSELKKRNKLLSTATGSYQGGMIPKETIPYFDYVSLMSYDAVGPSWGEIGREHSPIEQAKNDIALWRGRGLTRDKLILGLPFYGYGFGKYKNTYAYKSIVQEFDKLAFENDVIGKACSKCDYVTFNNASTIKKKTRLGMEQGSGVMIWELSHDTLDGNSLLNVITEKIKGLDPEFR